MSVETPNTMVPSLEFNGEAADAQRYHEFAGALGGVRQIEVIDPHLNLSGEDPIHYAAQDFLRHRQAIGSTLYVNPNHAQSAGAAVVGCEPRSSRGGLHSAHGVMFVDVMISSGEVVPVAVKPHVDEPEYGATREYLTDLAVRQLELEDVRPFGLLIGENGKPSYSMTYLEEGLTTLDSVDWERIGSHPEEDRGLLELWDAVARQAALVHSRGNTCQRDMVPRNIAMRPDNGGVFFIDWERATVSTDKPRDAEARYNNSFTDLKSLLTSMALPTRIIAPDQRETGIGLLQGSVAQQWDAFKELVFNEYRDIRLGFVDTKHATHDRREVEDELVELEKSLHQHLRWINYAFGGDT